MIPGMNPKLVKQAMKRMGMKQEEISATQVIIKCQDKNIIIDNPNVIKINMMGEENFQISGKIRQESIELFTEDDIKTIMEQTNCTKNQALETLKEENDLAQAILKLKSQ